jgi:hypothetical protein
MNGFARALVVAPLSGPTLFAGRALFDRLLREQRCAAAVRSGFAILERRSSRLEQSRSLNGTHEKQREFRCKEPYPCPHCTEVFLPSHSQA